jgi:hypothetical protein
MSYGDDEVDKQFNVRITQSLKYPNRSFGPRNMSEEMQAQAAVVTVEDDYKPFSEDPHVLDKLLRLKYVMSSPKA